MVKKLKNLNYLETENKELKSNLTNLIIQIKLLEMQSIFSNIELQCIPEPKNVNIIKQIKQVPMNYNLMTSNYILAYQK